MPGGLAHDGAAHAHGAKEGHGHAQMLRRWIWRDFANITLGCWLIAAPFTLGHFYTSPRLAASDVATGAAVVMLGVLTLSPRFDLLRWALCAAGVWLLVAPLVFWTPSPGAYSNDTLVGSLVIAFSVLIPMMPSRTHHEVMTAGGPDTPPGWSYNPSDWIQRGPIIAMALVGFFVSRYLAAYQLGHLPTVWDPFFRDGTRRVLESDVSRAWPISDAGLGAVSYMLEALSGFMGGRNRWRTMPWMVVMFGVLVVPLGIVSIVLVILQPVAVGAWCTLCLVTAAAMLIMIAPAIDEIVAMGQFMAAARREGRPFWRTFWVGGTLGAPESPAAPGSTATASPSLARRITAALDLNNLPWNLVACAALGVWLMAAPAVLGSSERAADADRLLGALAVTFAVIAFGEISRPARFVLLPIGLVLAGAAWAWSGGTPLGRVNDLVAGLALAGMCLRRGRISERFAGWNRVLV